MIVLGGPAMLIGLGGGAASSVASGDSAEDLDFASVQRDNPEMERRCQEVHRPLRRAAARDNPIATAHDVGAGGLSNAIPELLHDSGLGGVIDLAKVPSDDPSLSPMQLWCNESQERYVLGVAGRPRRRVRADLRARALPVRGRRLRHRRRTPGRRLRRDARDRAPSATATGRSTCRWTCCSASRRRCTATPRRPPPAPLAGAATGTAWTCARPRLRVLAHPTVASKNFLVTIGDRTVGGLTARDQMVGPWQLPLADCAITLSGFDGFVGEAMAIGERTPLALIDAAAAARMAVGEAITNLCAAPVESLDRIKLSANWMAAAGHPGEDARLFDAVKAVGLELCPELDLSIPVGKDSLSMQAQWHADGARAQVGVAGVADRQRVRAGGRRAPAAHAAARARRRVASCG